MHIIVMTTLTVPTQTWLDHVERRFREVLDEDGYNVGQVHAEPVTGTHTDAELAMATAIVAIRSEVE